MVGGGSGWCALLEARIEEKAAHVQGKPTGPNFPWEFQEQSPQFDSSRDVRHIVGSTPGVELGGWRMCGRKRPSIPVGRGGGT